MMTGEADLSIRPELAFHRLVVLHDSLAGATDPRKRLKGAWALLEAVQNHPGEDVEPLIATAADELTDISELSPDNLWDSGHAHIPLRARLHLALLPQIADPRRAWPGEVERAVYRRGAKVLQAALPLASQASANAAKGRGTKSDSRVLDTFTSIAMLTLGWRTRVSDEAWPDRPFNILPVETIIRPERLGRMPRIQPHLRAHPKRHQRLYVPVDIVTRPTVPGRVKREEYGSAMALGASRHLADIDNYDSVERVRVVAHLIERERKGNQDAHPEVITVLDILSKSVIGAISGKSAAEARWLSKK